MKKLRTIFRLLFSDQYILIVEKNKTYHINFSCDEHMLSGYCPGIAQYLRDTDAAVREVNEIINQK